MGCDTRDEIQSQDTQYFNPRTHRGVRHKSNFATHVPSSFQSTHPSWGATIFFIRQCQKRLLFQSTHPSWGATFHVLLQLPTLAISIHAPIVGCDLFPTSLLSKISYFNPRTHRGVRLCKMDVLVCSIDISIHAPIVGCDP